MRKLLFTLALVSACSVSWAQRSIRIDGIETFYTVGGLETRKPGEPVAVFESGMGMSGENFSILLSRLSGNIPWFTYDRNGIGHSGVDIAIKSDSDVVKKLHRTLQTLNIQPPYLLVGHSIGGALARLFAAFYPKETAGLVLIDPTDFMLTQNENDSAAKSSKSKIGYQELWLSMLTDMAGDKNMPEGVRTEMKRELNVSKDVFFKEYNNLNELRDIPVAVLIAYNRPIERYEEEMNAKLGINGRAWFDTFDDLRIKHYRNLIKHQKNSEIILLPGYSHGIHHQDPGKVGDVINSVFKKSSVKP
ncbi:alpha/beta hydrolase [Chitinophaga sp. G-6-1-13]|uniref:Alpha/beta hydrolase n=1 Tax=Chitinophaga fulva TaxID=2728842 RepID=A0A848GTT6_9BACT|nr:alpha/beta hydrolase [Chitinophaga fulva]NML40050.1 alpha/beta hydrolase [Chitinophaga fulva]